METVYFSPVLLGLCGLIAYYLTVLYDKADEWISNRHKLLFNDLYRKKCKKIRDIGIQYYMDVMENDPERLAKHLAKIRTKELIHSNGIEELYYRLKEMY